MTAVVAAFAPACMDADELALWRAEAGTETERRAATDLIPCHDCTLGYAAEMRAIGRCNGTPGGAEEDEPMETPEAAAVVEAAEIIGRRRITAIAPCPTCVHARVCRLRPADELDVRVSLPALDPALDLTLTATVECAEYVRAKGGAKPVVTAGHPHTAETKAAEAAS